MPPIALLIGSAVVGALMLLLTARVSVRRWINWAQLAADYGRVDILNAPHIESEQDVVRLRTQFDAWSRIIADGTDACCRDIDAFRVQFFDAPLSNTVAGFNDEHRYIRQLTAERVDRLLHLAAQLEVGETRLRPTWVRRVEGI